MYKNIVTGSLMLSVLVLTGCSNTSPDMAGQTIFDAIEESFLSSNVFVYPSIETGAVRESWGLYSNTDTDQISTDLTIGLSIDTQDKDMFSSLTLSWILEDKEYSDIFASSWVIHYIKTGDNAYMKREDGYVSMGEGNTESFMVSMIIDSIRGQWLLMDDNALIDSSLLDLSAWSAIFAFTEQLKSIFSGDMVLVAEKGVSDLYPTTLAHSGYMGDVFSSIYDIIGYEYTKPVTVALQWYIQKQPNPAWIIQQLMDSGNNVVIQGHIWIREGQLTIAQQDKQRKILREEKRNNVTIAITHTSNTITKRSTQLLVSHKKIADTLAARSYSWYVASSLPGAQEKENLLTFPIAGLYTIAIVDDAVFIEPTRYVLMSQLFGDEYGILSLLESE
jgi:hypothetical protein